MDIFSRIAKWLRRLFVTLALAYLAIVLGADPTQWALEHVFGAERIRAYSREIIAGRHERILQWGVIFAFVSFAYAFLIEPFREVLRRYKSPYGRFWTDAKLRRELSSIQRDLADFCNERDAGTPDLHDRQNYVLGDVPPGAVAFEGGAANAVIGRNADPNDVRAMLNARDNRLRYEQETLRTYEREYFSRDVCALREASVRNLITLPDEAQIVAQLLQRPYPFNVTVELRRHANLSGLCLARMGRK
jgi:hypothetical protein